MIRHPQRLVRELADRAGCSEEEKEALREEVFLSLLILSCEVAGDPFEEPELRASACPPVDRRA